MNKRLTFIIQYFLVMVVTLVPVFLIHKNALRGRTMLLPGKEIEAILIDSRDRVWVATKSAEVVMYESMKPTSYGLIGNSAWISRMGIDENDQVWVIAGPGWLAPFSPATIYKFNGSEWVAIGETVGIPETSKIPCCLPSDENIVSSQIFDAYSAFLDTANPVDWYYRPKFLKDKHGNMWAGTDSGLVLFSPNFKIPTPPLERLHLFLSSGGYRILWVIITIVFYEFASKFKITRSAKTILISNGSTPLIFSLASLSCIMAGWLIGTSAGRLNPGIWIDSDSLGQIVDASSQAAGQGGVTGGVWGFILGSFLGFGGFGLTIARAWQKKYPNMRRRHMLIMVLGWLFIPIVFFILITWFSIYLRR